MQIYINEMNIIDFNNNTILKSIMLYRSQGFVPSHTFFYYYEQNDKLTYAKIIPHYALRIPH